MPRPQARVCLILTLLILVSSRTVVAQKAGATDSTADEQAVRQAAIQFVEAYNAHDAKALSEMFGPNARMEDGDSEAIEGREAIEQAYSEEFQASPTASISLAVDSLKFITPDVAVEEGAVEFYPDGNTLTARSRYVVVHLKKDNAWRIISSRSLERDVLSNYERLRDLEFLIGDWIDEGNDSVVEYTARWDDNKSYLLNGYQVVEDGVIRLRGTQRIGWDAQSKVIRSWVFDSNGGFSEGVWQFVDGAWQVRATVVGADGQSSAAIRTYAPVDHDHIIVSTREHVVAGETQPDLDITLTRRAPAAEVTAAE